MVAYSFKAQFAEPIMARTKRQTIRADRKRHARPGETIQLFVGMRTRHCRKIIPDVVCLDVKNIRVDVTGNAKGMRVWVEGEEYSPDDIEELARADGFDSAFSMALFWIENHGRVLFEGVRIRWHDAGARD